jgi:hypothetical protein
MNKKTRGYQTTKYRWHGVYHCGMLTLSLWLRFENGRTFYDYTDAAVLASLQRWEYECFVPVGGWLYMEFPKFN